MTITDSHIHLFSDGYPGQYGALFPRGGEVRTYEAIRAVHHIERALVVGYEGDAWATGNNRYIAGLARTHSWIVPLAFCLPSNPPTSRQLKNWWTARFHGISLYLNEEADVDGILAWPQDTIDALNEKRAIISLNVSLAHIARLRPLFERLGETRIMASHLGLPGTLKTKLSAAAARQLLAPLTEQADLPHLGVKFSGFYACNDFPHAGIEPVLDALKNSFGEKRLYWGSDFSPALDQVSFAQTIEAAQNVLGGASETKAVLYKNLCRAIDRVR